MKKKIKRNLSPRCTTLTLSVLQESAMDLSCQGMNHA